MLCPGGLAHGWYGGALPVTFQPQFTSNHRLISIGIPHKTVGNLGLQVGMSKVTRGLVLGDVGVPNALMSKA